MEDIQALQRIAAGDEIAACEFERYFRPRLMRFLAGRGILAPDAEDLVQDALGVVFAQLREGRFRGTSGVSTWVTGILNHKVVDYWRARDRSAVESRVPMTFANEQKRAESLAQPAGGVDAETRAILHQILDMLPRLHRTILLLHETEGWTTDEIAERLKMKTGTVGRKLWEAKQKLGEMGRSPPCGRDQNLPERVDVKKQLD